MPRIHRPEVGWLGEHVVDMDVVRGSGFRVVPWIPLIDAHGIDRAYSLDGIGQPALVQVKTSASLDEAGRFHWTFRAGSFGKQDNVWAVLGATDRNGWPTDDGYWCLDAATVIKLASREYDRALRADIYQLAAYPARPDRLSPYRCTPEELWRRLFSGQRLAPIVPLRFPTLELDQGGIYEFATITDTMIGNRKDLLVFRPAFDIHGRDLLVQLIGSPHALYLQVKGTALLRGDDQVRVRVRRSTFVAAEDFWIVVRLWNRRLHAIHPECWLIPSIEFERRTAHQHDVHYHTFEAHLDPLKDSWADRRYPATKLADVLRDAFERRRLAALRNLRQEPAKLVEGRLLGG
jgi:hypothetical protein